MADLHIDEFYRDCALIFTRLYQQFPRKFILYTDEICGPDTPDEYGLQSSRFQACFSAMIWLGEQGFLSHKGPIKQEAIDQAVLTEKGFLLLTSRSDLALGEAEYVIDDLPAPLREDAQTNIMYIRRVLKSGSSIFISQCMNHIFNQAKN